MAIRCPTLSELPLPPYGKTGWPWTEESPQFSDFMGNGNEWPRISIITPNYNKGRFIEETIRSVLLQGYPNLEYIIIDGGSTDNSIEIIKKYENWLTHWVSEADRGQSHAINKGLGLATGEFAAYQNSDDIYWPNALKTIGKILGTGRIDVLFAPVNILDMESRFIRGGPIPEPKLDLLIQIWKRPTNILPSQGFFCRLDLLHSIGLYKEDYHYEMDFDVICRVIEITPRERIAKIDELVGAFRIYEGSKTGMMITQKAFEELLNISRRYWTCLTGENPAEAALKARKWAGFLGMCRASRAIEKRQVWTMLHEITRAWHNDPRLLITRWNVNIFCKLLRSIYVGKN